MFQVNGEKVYLINMVKLEYNIVNVKTKLKL